MSLAAATHRQAEVGLALCDEYGLFLIFLFQLPSFCLRWCMLPDAFYIRDEFLLRSSHSESDFGSSYSILYFKCEFQSWLSEKLILTCLCTKAAKWMAINSGLLNPRKLFCNFRELTWNFLYKREWKANQKLQKIFVAIFWGEWRMWIL